MEWFVVLDSRVKHENDGNQDRFHLALASSFGWNDGVKHENDGKSFFFRTDEKKLKDTIKRLQSRYVVSSELFSQSQTKTMDQKQCYIFADYFLWYCVEYMRSLTRHADSASLLSLDGISLYHQ